MKIFLLISSMLCPVLSFAFFCPTNFSQIELGDTIEQVQTTCGKPDKQESKEGEPMVPQEWRYLNEMPSTVGISSMRKPHGNLSTNITFDKDGKVVSINSNGVGVGATTICGSGIALGDSREKVKAACGDPLFVSKQETAPPTAQEKEANKITTFYYNTNPPAKLIFEGGKLTSKE